MEDRKLGPSIDVCGIKRAIPISSFLFVLFGGKVQFPEPSFIYQIINSEKLLCFTFINLFRLFLIRLFKSTTTQRRSLHSTDTVPKLHAEALLPAASKGLVQGPYMAARAGFEPKTLRTKDDESANKPPCTPHNAYIFACHRDRACVLHQFFVYSIFNALSFATFSPKYEKHVSY